MGGGGGGEGGDWWNQFLTFDAESKFAKKKKFFCKTFTKFLGKNWNGFVSSKFHIKLIYQIITISISVGVVCGTCRPKRDKFVKLESVTGNKLKKMAL